MTLRTLEQLNNDFMTSATEIYEAAAAEAEKPTSVSSAAATEALAGPKRLPITPRSIHPMFTDAANPANCAQESRTSKSKLFASISDALFSAAIFMVLVVALASSAEGNAPRMIFGHAYFAVTSPSMQDEIPKGAFILVKNTDPGELKAGDNITYMVDRSTSVTHKIVDVYDNYFSSGARGFQTQGVNNVQPDKDIVHESSVVGKVVLVIPGLGAFFTSLGNNIFLVFIIFGLCVLLSFLVRGLFAKPSSKRKGGIVNVN